MVGLSSSVTNMCSKLYVFKVGYKKWNNKKLDRLHPKMVLKTYIKSLKTHLAADVINNHILVLMEFRLRIF